MAMTRAPTTVVKEEELAGAVKLCVRGGGKEDSVVLSDMESRGKLEGVPEDEKLSSG